MTKEHKSTALYAYPINGWSFGNPKEEIPETIVEVLNKTFDNWIFCDLDFMEKCKGVMQFSCNDSHFIIQPDEEKDGSDEFIWKRGESLFISNEFILMNHVNTEEDMGFPVLSRTDAELDEIVKKATEFNS